MRAITLIIILLVAIFLIGCVEVEEPEELEIPEEPPEEDTGDEDIIPIPEFPEEDVEEEEEIVEEEVPSGPCKEEGETANPNKERVCCEGLMSVVNSRPWTGTACLDPKVGIDNPYICVKCGDGECGKGENKCNCPQDCHPLGCIEEGETSWPNEKWEGTDEPKSCCAGLKREWNYKLLEDGSCEEIHKASKDEYGNYQVGGHQKICINCRDGNCGIGENGCNCPWDCKDFRCAKLGETPVRIIVSGNSSIFCCEGLKATKKIPLEYLDDDCTWKEYGMKTTIGNKIDYKCIACGDKTCDPEYENRCNCPEDCS